jgi:membrane protein
MTLIGYANLDSSAILSSMEAYLPAEVYSFIADIVVDVVDKQRDGLLSFSILFAVYYSSSGFRSFMEASNRALGIRERRNIILRFLVSVFCVILFALSILLALLGIVFGQQIINLASSYSQSFPLVEVLKVLRIIIPELLVFLLILSFYIFVPAQRICFRCAIPGAIFATLTWTIFTMLFQFYVNSYTNYSKFYGALGTVIILLLWLLLTSIIMLIGIEINALLMELDIVKKPDSFYKDAKNPGR